MAGLRMKSENLSCRISSEHKALIERAAQHSGFSVSDFVVHTLVAAASEVLRDESAIRLSPEQWNRFTSALEQPAREPGEATRKAMALFHLGHDEGDHRVW